MTSKSSAANPNRWVYILSITIFITLIICYFAVPTFQQEVNQGYEIFTSNDQERITKYVQQFGIAGIAIFILVMVVQMFLVVVPSWLLMIIAVLAYGKFWGVVLAVTAVFIASSIGYGIGYSLSEETLYQLMGEQTEQKLEQVVKKHGIGAVIIFRIAPFLSNDAISFVGGILQMGYWRFIGATLAGITPLAILIAYFSEDTERLKNGLMWVGGASLVGYALYIGYDYWRQKEKNT